MLHRRCLNPSFRNYFVVMFIIYILCVSFASKSDDGSKRGNREGMVGDVVNEWNSEVGNSVKTEGNKLSTKSDFQNFQKLTSENPSSINKRSDSNTMSPLGTIDVSQKEETSSEREEEIVNKDVSSSDLLEGLPNRFSNLQINSYKSLDSKIYFTKYYEKTEHLLGVKVGEKNENPIKEYGLDKDYLTAEHKMKTFSKKYFEKITQGVTNINQLFLNEQTDLQNDIVQYIRDIETYIEKYKEKLPTHDLAEDELCTQYITGDIPEADININVLLEKLNLLKMCRGDEKPTNGDYNGEVFNTLHQEASEEDNSNDNSFLEMAQIDSKTLVSKLRDFTWLNRRIVDKDYTISLLTRTLEELTRIRENFEGISTFVRAYMDDGSFDCTTSEEGGNMETHFKYLKNQGNTEEYCFAPNENFPIFIFGLLKCDENEEIVECTCKDNGDTEYTNYIKCQFIMSKPLYDSLSEPTALEKESSDEKAMSSEEGRVAEILKKPSDAESRELKEKNAEEIKMFGGDISAIKYGEDMQTFSASLCTNLENDETLSVEITREEGGESSKFGLSREDCHKIAPAIIKDKATVAFSLGSFTCPDECKQEEKNYLDQGKRQFCQLGDGMFIDETMYREICKSPGKDVNMKAKLQSLLQLSGDKDDQSVTPDFPHDKVAQTQANIYFLSSYIKGVFSALLVNANIRESLVKLVENQGGLSDDLKEHLSSVFSALDRNKIVKLLSQIPIGKNSGLRHAQTYYLSGRYEGNAYLLLNTLRQRLKFAMRLERSYTVVDEIAEESEVDPNTYLNPEEGFTADILKMQYAKPFVLAYLDVCLQSHFKSTSNTEVLPHMPTEKCILHNDQMNSYHSKWFYRYIATEY